MESRFICTDLVVESLVDLTRLSQALDQRGLFTHLTRADDRWRLVANSNQSGDARRSTLDLVEVIERMTPDNLAVLEAAECRWLDLGFESGTAPFDISEDVSPDILERLVKLGCGIRVTVYACRPGN